MDFRQWLEITKIIRRTNEMIWKNREINKFFDISLSDCDIKNMQIEENNIIVNFSKYGFIVRDKNNEYYRTNGAQIVIKGCDVNEISIKEVRTQRLSDDIFFETSYDIDPNKFIERINTKKWHLVIVKEFYAVKSAMYIVRMREGENRFWCHIEINFEDLEYLWNEIKFDWKIT